MKKFVIAGGIAVVVLLAAAPAVTGWLAERGSEERLETLATQLPLAAVTSHTYRRGWLSSEETTTVEFFKGMRLPGAAKMVGTAQPEHSPSFTLTVHSLIQHGPLPGFSSVGLARVESTVSFAVGEGKSDAAPTVITSPKIETVLGFLGGGRTTVSTKSYAQEPLKAGGYVSADPVEVVVNFGRHLDRYDVDWKAPHVLFRDNTGSTFELSGFRLVAHNHRLLRTLYAGDAELSLGTIEISGLPSKDGPISLGLKAVRMQTQADGVGEFMNTSMLFTIGAAEAAGKSLQGLKFDFSADHWQADAFERLAAGSRAATFDTGADPKAQAAALLKIWQSAGVALASHDPSFTIRDLEFATSDGGAKLKGSVGIKGATESDFATPIDPRRIIPKVSLDFDITLDETLAAALQAAQQAKAPPAPPPPPAKKGANPTPAAPAVPADPLQPLIERGFVTREDGKLHTRIVFADGAFTVNGKPFPGARPAAP